MPQQIETNVGTVEVRVDGPAEAPPVVLSHPALTNHDLWNGLTAALSPDHRVIRATLPLGAHRIPAVRDRINPENLADALAEHVSLRAKEYVPLRSRKPVAGALRDPRWRLMVNEEVEAES